MTTNTSDSSLPSGSEAHRGTQQIYQLAISLGVPDQLARRLSQFAVDHSVEMKNHMVLTLTKADLAVADEISRETFSHPGGLPTERKTYRSQYSTIVLTFIRDESRGREHYMIEGTRQTQHEVCPIVGLTYEVFQNLRSGREYRINVTDDIIQPLNTIYERHHGADVTYGNNAANQQWHRRFRAETLLEDMTNTGRTQRVSPLFTPKKVDHKNLMTGLADQLKALRSYENIESIEHDKAQRMFKIITKPIKSGTTIIGAFEFIIDMAITDKAMMRRLPHNLCDSDSLMSEIEKAERSIHRAHPFVSSTTRDGFGSICFGDADILFKDSMKAHDMFSAVNVILELLTSRTGHPYIQWDQYLKLVKADKAREEKRDGSK